MSIERISDHVPKGIARLVTQYNGNKDVEGLTEAMIQEFQLLEDSFSGFCDAFNVFTAAGDQLDIIGRIVNVERFEAESDEDFRQRALATISLNVSGGTPEDLIRTFNFLRGVSFSLYQEFYPGEVSISSSSTFEDQHEVDLVLRTLDGVLPAGVRLNHIGVFDENEAFAFDGNLPGMGFGTVVNQEVGGLFSKIKQRNNFFTMGSVNTISELEAKNEGFGTVQDGLIGGLFART